MSELREAAKAALTAYEKFRDVDDIDGLDDAMDRLRAALAKPEVEPPRDEWRPASEPPEDGRRVLIWVAKSGGETFRPAYCPAGGWTSVFDGETLVAWRDINPPTEGAE